MSDSSPNAAPDTPPQRQTNVQPECFTCADAAAHGDTNGQAFTVTEHDGSSDATAYDRDTDALADAASQSRANTHSERHISAHTGANFPADGDANDYPFPRSDDVVHPPAHRGTELSAYSDPVSLDFVPHEWPEPAAVVDAKLIFPVAFSNLLHSHEPPNTESNFDPDFASSVIISPHADPDAYSDAFAVSSTDYICSVTNPHSRTVRNDESDPVAVVATVAEPNNHRCSDP